MESSAVGVICAYQQTNEKNGLKRLLIMSKNTVKKILIITPFYPPNIGGAETFAYDLVSELQEHCQADVCTIRWGKNKTFKGVGIKQFLDVFPKLFFPALRRLGKGEYDVVYTIGLQSTLIGRLLRMFRKFEHRSILLALYDFKDKSALFKKVSRFAFRRASRIYVEGETGREDVLGLKAHKEQTYKFQHWCDQKVFRPCKQFHNGWRFTVLFIGRSIPEKGKHVIEKVETFFKKYKDVRFVYVENVKFKDLPKYYQSADVVCIPSLYAEGVPRVAIEALSSGCALITSDRGALPELIGDHCFGFAVKPTVQEFKKWILYLYDNRILLEDAKERAYRYSRMCLTKDNAKVFL